MGFLKFHKLIFILLISLLFNFILVLNLWQSYKKLHLAQTNIISLQNDRNSLRKNLQMWQSNQPVLVDQKKDIPIDQRSYILKLFFDNYQNTTYTQSEYFYKGDRFNLFSINLKQSFIHATIQWNNSSNVIDPINYEGIMVKDTNSLKKQLSQSTGVYQEECENCLQKYEVVKNKNNIIMKKTYSDSIPLYFTELYEFIYGDRYYAFTAQTPEPENSGPGTLIFRDLTFYKQLKAKEFNALNEFIDTLQISGY